MTIVSQVSDAFPWFVLGFVVRCSLLWLLTFCALWLLRVKNAALEHAAWRFVLFAMLILPAGQTLGSLIPIPSYFRPAMASLSPLQHPAAEAPATNAFVIPRKPGASDADGVRRPPVHVPWAMVAFAVYLLATAIMIARIAVGWRLIHRAARRMKRLDDPRLAARTNAQCERLGLLMFPRCRTSSGVMVPVTFGWKDPVILLPEDWVEWPTDKLDLVLAHELSHVQRGDYPVRLLAALNKALFWFHPLAWWLDKRLAELSEHLSDDAALQTFPYAQELYARVLGDFVSSVDRAQGRFRWGIAMAVSAKGDYRIRRALDTQRVLCSRPRLCQKALVLVLGVPALVLLAGPQTERQSPAGGITAPGAQVLPAGAQAPRRRRVPAPLFGAAYVDALRGVLELEEADAAALRQKLAENPDDFAARLKLLAYTRRADRAGLPESRDERVELVLWLVGHRPDSEILASTFASVFDALRPDQMQRAIGLWDEAKTKWPSDARVWWNAAGFYRQVDRRLYADCLERAVALAPDNENYAQSLGLLYAGAILSTDPQSGYRDTPAAEPGLDRRSRDRLDKTRNAYVLEGAVRLLQSDYNRSVIMRAENEKLGAMARQYFERARALDPDVDELWVYPQVDPKMMGMFASGSRPPDDDKARQENAVKQVRRLPPDAFPELPPAIRDVLRVRGCTVPQPSPSGKPRNVIRGEFFESGQTGWAVLCSVNEQSSILAFRDGADTRPEELAKREDRGYMQGTGHGIEYSREIGGVDRAFIMTHYRAYGGPQPPPIDHLGIDDAFLGKASVTYYRFGGKWLELSGSD